MKRSYAARSFRLCFRKEVIAILDTTGKVVVKYKYDAWGNCRTEYPEDATAQARSVGACNPFRYRGYYYCSELGLYYLKSRFYDPSIGRFISADSLGYLDPHTVGGLNLFAYCNNNPVMNVDPTGRWFETVFDLFSLGVSVVEVVVNPTDPWAWAGLAGDALDLIPFVTGVGESIKGTRVVAKSADLADTALDTIKIQKAVDFTDGALDSMKSLEQVGDFTKSTRELGTRIHKGYKTYNLKAKEYKKISGIRPDFYDGKSIFELKPYNKRSLRLGVNQLVKYKRRIGKGKMILEFYFKR